MSMYVLAGTLRNAIFQLYSTTGGGTPDVGTGSSGSYGSSFGTVNAHTGDPGQVFRFTALGTAPSVTYSLDFLGGLGSMESNPTNGPIGTWTNASTGTGEIVQTATVHSGTNAARFNTGTGTALMYKDFTVRTGQRIKFDGWFRGDGGTGFAELYVQNLQTGKYGLGGVNWTSATVPGIAENTASYTNRTLEITVESYDTCRSDTVVLRVTMGCTTASKTVYIDDFEMIPAVKFASVHGHNIDPASGLTLRSSTDNFSGSDDLVATFTVKQPSFYTTFSETFRRYWRFKFTGRNSDRSGSIWIGEWVLGEHTTMTKGPAYPMALGHVDPQIRVPKRVGASTSYQLGTANQRSFPLVMRAENMTQRLEILQEMFERSRGGEPIIIVPHHTDSFTEVLYGRLADALPHEWQTRAFVNLSTEVVEMAFPLVTSE